MIKDKIPMLSISSLIIVLICIAGLILLNSGKIKDLEEYYYLFRDKDFIPTLVLFLIWVGKFLSVIIGLFSLSLFYESMKKN